jgi:hypothetical protein
MPVRTRVRGVRELTAGVHKLAGKIAVGSRDDFQRVADQVAAQVRATVPKNTGLLASTVVGRSSGQGASVSMGAGTRYAQYVEFGGRGHPKNSDGNYLYPAARAAGPLLEEAGEKAANQEIGNMSWPSP